MEWIETKKKKFIHSSNLKFNRDGYEGMMECPIHSIPFPSKHSYQNWKEKLIPLTRWRRNANLILIFRDFEREKNERRKSYSCIKEIHQIPFILLCCINFIP